MSNWDSFIDAYKKADASVQSVIDSDKIGIFCDMVIAEHSVDKTHKKTLMFLVVDVLLSLARMNDVPDTLKAAGISEPTATKLTVKILNFVESISKEPQTEPLAASETEAAQEATTEEKQDDLVTHFSPAAVSNEQELPEQNLVHTEEEPVIQATPQDEVLNNRPPLTDTPSYARPNDTSEDEGR